MREDWEDIELYGKQQLEYLRKFLPYANGTASDDTLRRFFCKINTQEFQKISSNMITLFTFALAGFAIWLAPKLHRKADTSATH